MDKDKSYISCGVCNLMYDESTVLQNINQDACCADCFKKTLGLENQSSCQQNFGDNQNITLQHAEASKTGRISNSTKLIPKPEIYVQNPNFVALQLSASTASIMSVSKRPLKCPMADCSRYISVGTLEKHFLTEHKEVPRIATKFDARCASQLFPRDMRYGVVYCVVLLRIVDDNMKWLSQQESRNNMSFYEYQPEQPQPVIMVMTARIPDYFSEDCDRNIAKDDKTYVTADQKIDNPEEVFRPGDRIIVWAASNVAISLSYTVAVSTLDNEIRQKYFGPMLTMNESPEKICREGNCLILTQLHCIAMSNNGMKPMGLDVVIHGPD